MNIIKARCTCDSRATIIRTEPVDPETTILTARCDSKNCQRVFQVSVTFHQEIIPPILQPRSSTDHKNPIIGSAGMG